MRICKISKKKRVKFLLANLIFFYRQSYGTIAKREKRKKNFDLFKMIILAHSYCNIL